MPKPKSQTAAGKAASASEQQIDVLVRQLANRPYGDGQGAPLAPSSSEENELVRTSFTLPRLLLQELEDEALSNKRRGVEPKSVSAIIRAALSKRHK